MSWLIPRNELSLEQIRAIQLTPKEHRAILGAPGSGKTQLLLYRARYLCDEHSVKPERFHIFVFTNVLKDYIRSALADLNLPENSVSTIDHWCLDYHKTHISGRVPWNSEARCPDFAKIRAAVRQKLAGSRPLFDFVLVDEGQDLDADCFELLKVLTPHITVCVDHKQQIYDHGAAEDEILRGLGLRRPSLILVEAFRCCPYIVGTAAEFIADADERSAFLNQTRVAQTKIETLLLYEAADWQDERRRLIEVLRERQLLDRLIGILFPLNRQVEGFAKGLRETGLEVETLKSTGLNFNNNRPKLLSYHSAKGLTFDSVLLPRLVVNSFPKMSQERIEKLLYVGITRGTRWVYFSTLEGTGLPALKKLRQLTQHQPPVLTIQTNGHNRGYTAPAASAPEGDILDIL